jgi:hypothetical protein
MYVTVVWNFYAGFSIPQPTPFESHYSEWEGWIQVLYVTNYFFGVLPSEARVSVDHEITKRSPKTGGLSKKS